MKIPVIAIVGRPNVGKSTLFNRITGRRRAIVNDESGVTRDRLYSDADWGGCHFRLIDTGGITPGDDKSIQSFIKKQTVAAIGEADMIICLFDGRAGVTNLDSYIVELVRKAGKKTFFVVNKAGDNMKTMSRADVEDMIAPFYELGLSAKDNQLFGVSAEHGVGVDALLDVVTTEIMKGRDENAEGSVDTNAGDEIRVAIIGRPNAGKSTLLNRLAGSERVIAHSMPGTTRDCIDISFAKDGKNYVFVDTAGLKKKSKTIETLDKFSTIKTLDAIQRAKIIILLVDANEGFTHQDSALLEHAWEEGKGLLIAFNKWDDLKTPEKILKDFYEEKLYKMHRPPFLCISAKTGSNVDELFKEIDKLKEALNFKISTSGLNKVLEDLKAAKAVPSYRGKNVKFYYATQIRSNPPAFVIFVNYVEGIPESYKRYLINHLQELVGYGVPIRLTFRKRK